MSYYQSLTPLTTTEREADDLLCESILLTRKAKSTYRLAQLVKDASLTREAREYERQSTEAENKAYTLLDAM